MLIGWGHEDAFWGVGDGLYPDWGSVKGVFLNVNV